MRKIMVVNMDEFFDVLQDNYNYDEYLIGDLLREYELLFSSLISVDMINGHLEVEGDCLKMIKQFAKHIKCDEFYLLAHHKEIF